MKFLADKMGSAFLWCGYLAFDASIIVGAALYFTYRYIKTKVIQPCSD